MRIISVSLVLQNYLRFSKRWYTMLAMNTNDVKKLTGFTERQLGYLLNQIDMLKREKTQGKAREYSPSEIMLLKSIAKMRAEGVSIRDINKVLNVIEKNPDKAATIAVYQVKNKKPIIKLELNTNADELVAAVENHFYTGQGPKPDLWILADGAWIDEHPMYEGTVNLPDDNQLELDLTAEESVIMNEA